MLHDHHGIALQMQGSLVRVSLPVILHDTTPVNGNASASDYFEFTRTELQKFQIDLSAMTLEAQKPLGSSLPGQRDISHDRSLLWNDQVHYYQDGNWLSAPW